MWEARSTLFEARLRRSLVAVAQRASTLVAVAGFAIGTSTIAALPPVEIVTGRANAPCRTHTFYRPVPVYRDPSLFLGSFAAYVADPSRGLSQLLRERPLLTKLSGKASLREVGEPRAFRSFPIIQQMYGDVDRRFLSDEALRIVSVVLCGEGEPYRDTLGFVLESDLGKAEWPEEGLPPSIEPNPIPLWRDGRSAER